MNWLKSILTGLASVLHGTATTVVPGANPGTSAAVTALLGLALQYAPVLVSLIPPPYGAAVTTLLPLLGKLLTVALTVFAAAHVAQASGAVKPAA